MDQHDLKEMVRTRYGGIAQAASGAESCCGPAASCCSPAATDPEGKARQMGYSATALAAVPEGANLGLGCGNPQAIAALQPGEVDRSRQWRRIRLLCRCGPGRPCRQSHWCRHDP